MAHRILVGDCRTTLREIPDRSVQCIVTSPPYWGLRDYGHPDQIGLEPTPEEYIAHLVDVFRETRRVLRDDGVLWLNLGDSYASKWPCRRPEDQLGMNVGSLPNGKREARPPRMRGGLKEKDLVGIPWSVAFALRSDGWYLRQDIIWAKGNCLPESVSDRCTRSHEYLFMLTKKPSYFYDADAIREPGTGGSHPQGHNATPIPNKQTEHGYYDGLKELRTPEGTLRNKRSVWNVNPRPFDGAHFAVMPPALVEPCILAGTSAAGCCPNCGAPWDRVTEKRKVPDRPNRVQGRKGDATHEAHGPDHREGNRHSLEVHTKGWGPSCKCDHAPVPCTVLDPFSGSGTVGMVAKWHGRDSILCDLNPEYVKLIEERVTMDRTDTGGWKPAVANDASLDLLGEL